MTIEIAEFDIAGPKLLVPTRFSDERGFFSEIFNSRTFANFGITEPFVQDNTAFSNFAGTVRGLHFQAPPHAQAKLLRVARGIIFDVAVDIRSGSPTYGKHIAVELSADSWGQFYIPAGFAHGYCTLVPNCEVIYKVTSFYAPQADGGILWNDPALGIDWPAVAGTVLSDKDKAMPILHEIKTPFKA